mmetsp:Transcript_3194/g.11581  ORF Transcript_3194/g.11581 Transcript_3194/m.11581 type:complete len:230 (-) Transcript_3194:420-1109(-)
MKVESQKSKPNSAAPNNLEGFSDLTVHLGYRHNVVERACAVHKDPRGPLLRHAEDVSAVGQDAAAIGAAELLHLRHPGHQLDLRSQPRRDVHLQQSLLLLDAAGREPGGNEERQAYGVVSGPGNARRLSRKKLREQLSGPVAQGICVVGPVEPLLPERCSCHNLRRDPPRRRVVQNRAHHPREDAEGLQWAVLETLVHSNDEAHIVLPVRIVRIVHEIFPIVRGMVANP